MARDALVASQVTEDEKRLIERAAEEEELSVSSFLRRHALIGVVEVSRRLEESENREDKEAAYAHA